jgi:hypothetical protein
MIKCIFKIRGWDEANKNIITDDWKATIDFSSLVQDIKLFPKTFR